MCVLPEFRPTIEGPQFSVGGATGMRGTSRVAYQAASATVSRELHRVSRLLCF
jgi:hypothetical protein